MENNTQPTIKQTHSLKQAKQTTNHNTTAIKNKPQPKSTSTPTKHREAKLKPTQNTNPNKQQ